MPAQGSDEALFHLVAVPRGVFGLDEQADRAAGFLSGRQQPVESEYPRVQRVPLVPVEDQVVRAVRQLRMPRAEIQRIQLGQGTGADLTATVAGAFQSPVMQADKVLVTGEPEVTLQSISTLLDR